MLTMGALAYMQCRKGVRRRSLQDLQLELISVCGATGSTLGLLSLDKVGLQILAEAGTEKEKIYASEYAGLIFAVVSHV